MRYNYLDYIYYDDINYRYGIQPNGSVIMQFHKCRCHYWTGGMWIWELIIKDAFIIEIKNLNFI